jgi:multiple sugar transport system substrate-binding protein
MAHAADLTVIVPGGPDGEGLAAAAKDYQAATGKQIEVAVAPYDNVLDKVVSACSSKTAAYDVIQLDDPWFPLLTSNGCLERLSSYFQQAGTDGPDNDFVGKSLALCRNPYEKGPFYCLPYVGNAQLFFYNPQMMKEAGYTGPVDRWDEVLTAAKAVTEKGDGRSFGFVMRGVQGHPITDAFLPIFWSFGGQIFDAKGHAAINSPAGIAALKFFLQLRDVSPPGVSGIDSEELMNAMTTRTAAAAVFWPIFISRFEDPKASQVVGQVKYSAMPSETAVGKSMIGNWLLGISVSSTHKKEAFDFITWVTSREQIRKSAERGNSPVRVSVFQDPELIAKPEFRHFPVLLQALNNSEPRPRQPRWPEIVQEIGTELSAALTSAKTPEQALNDANAKMDAIVAR